jgi:hypothetical protein
MSSGSDRERVNGVIRQGTKVVGCVSLPDASEIFIKEFNHCYGQLRLEVENPETQETKTSTNPHTFRLPTWFRHVWHNRPNPSAPNDE